MILLRSCAGSRVAQASDERRAERSAAARVLAMPPTGRWIGRRSSTVPRGAILSGARYTGITLAQSRVGWGVKSAGGASDGIITLSPSGTQWAGRHGHGRDCCVSIPCRDLRARSSRSTAR